jgi:hypothetical protein
LFEAMFILVFIISIKDYLPPIESYKQIWDNTEFGICNKIYIFLKGYGKWNIYVSNVISHMNVYIVYDFPSIFHYNSYTKVFNYLHQFLI